MLLSHPAYRWTLWSEMWLFPMGSLEDGRASSQVFAQHDSEKIRATAFRVESGRNVIWGLWPNL